MGDAEILRIMENDKLRKIFETILDYLEASIAIRTKNKVTNIIDGNSKYPNQSRPAFIYPWSFSQILLNCSNITSENILQFCQSFASFIKIHKEERKYTYMSTRGNVSDDIASETWIDAPEEGPFIQFLKERKINTPISLDIPPDLTIIDAYRWFCVLTLFKSTFLEIEQLPNLLDPQNLFPKSFKEFSQIFLSQAAIQSDFADFPFIKFLCPNWRSPIYGMFIDPELKPSIGILPEFTAQNLCTAIWNKFSEFAVNNPEIVKNGALTYLEDQLKISDSRPGKIGSLKDINPLYIEYMQKEGWISPLPGNQFKLTSKMVRASIPNQIGNSNNNIAPILDDWWAQVIKLQQETKNVPPEQSKDSLIKDKGVGLENKFVVYAGIRHKCTMKDNLLQLEIKEAGISDIKAIEGLSSLTELGALYLSENKITAIRGLEPLTNLRHLHLRSNQIAKISGLEKLINLTTLHLSENNITEIRGLEPLTNLRHLHLRSNQIAKISGLDKLTHLTELYLNHNSITKVSGLDNLTELTKIDLSHNKIENLNDVLPGITNLPRLSSLDLENNSPQLTHQIEEQVKSKKKEDIVKHRFLN